MRASRLAAGGVVLCCAVAGISLGTGACGSDTPETPDGAALDGGDSGSDAPPVNCPSGKEPKDDPTCVTNDVGVFVSATGSDANAGTKEKPLATLGAALTKASGAGKGKIFVCEGSYTESVEIKSTVGVYGGFKCSDWSYSGTKPKFAGAKPDFVVKVDGASGLTLADLELDGKDGAANSGESSIALFVNLAQNVVVSRDALAAGVGAKGADGVLVPYSFPQQSDLNGKGPDGGAGGAANQVTCPDGQKTTGGKGGDIFNKNGDNGLPALDGGAGGTAVACLGTNAGGGNGSSATNSAPAAATTALGQLSATWIPAAGASGASGPPGQGGGGGGSTTGAGGGGGAGGCGGAGGPGGKGGGGSIPLLSIGSSLKVTSSSLVAKNAGSGGAGVSGQAAQLEYGFFAAGTPPGCSGGSGGKGGAGGAGAGGAGGISVGVLYKGTKPDIDSQTMGAIVTGTKGTKGSGGSGNDGIDGVAQAVLECLAPTCL